MSCCDGNTVALHVIDFESLCAGCDQFNIGHANRLFPDGVPECRLETTSTGQPCWRAFVAKASSGWRCSNWENDSTGESLEPRGALTRVC